MCRFCGHVPKCYNCNYSLTFYYKNNILKCSYCGYKTPFKTECSCCQKNTIKTVGIGIEYIEHYLKKNFPQAKIIKFDSDNIKKISQYK
ncbi:hypothetical protein ['Fragaria x ananassa' phyllody phytoplasma]|uniref:hypothetical protein n=1 Tax='Fragaria x ananassa' phyllody phytoplasma TaxID=2358428 RepID=UPI001CECF171|nr:hypothetical protein ['Fragaria x ananassa' phyllody phytoplasma]